MVTETKDSAAALRARAQEIEYLGTQFGLNGLPPPPELEAEYLQIKQSLAELEASAG